MKRFEQPIRREDLAGLSSVLFSGVAFIAATLAVWSLTSGLHITKSFAVSSGLFSNWIVWVGIAIGSRVVGRHVEQEMAPVRRTPAPVVMMPRRRTSAPPNDTTIAAA